MTKDKELRLNLSFSVEGCETKEEAFNQLEEKFGRENMTAENEFWDNMELVEIIEE